MEKKTRKLATLRSRESDNKGVTPFIHLELNLSYFSHHIPFHKLILASIFFPYKSHHFQAFPILKTTSTHIGT